jgi:outer membrane protein assembly factor BamB
VDEDLLYTVTARGDVVCLQVADGKEVWRKSYRRDFGGQATNRGYADRPFVDGDRLICAPGGNLTAVVALNKKTGAVHWRCSIEGELSSDCAATVISNAWDVRHYVVFLRGAVVGVSARDGRLLYSYDRIANGTANNYTPMVLGNYVLLASGHGKGLALLELHKDGDGLRAQEVYFKQMNLSGWHEGTVVLGDHLYVSANGLTCIEWKTGKVVWQAPGTRPTNLTCADGFLYLRSRQGTIDLVEATPSAYRHKGTFQFPGAVPRDSSTVPVITGGRLFVRDEDVLFCYDVLDRRGAK